MNKIEEYLSLNDQEIEKISEELSVFELETIIKMMNELGKNNE